MKKYVIAKPIILWPFLVTGFLLFNPSTLYSQANALVKFGNSYVNLTKKQVGGTVEPGDTLEIRNTIYINRFYNGAGQIFYIRYLDNIPTKTSILAGDSLRAITNEGLTFRRYTYAGADDAGTYLPSPPVGEYQVRINLGGQVPAAQGGFPEPTAPANNSITDLTGSSNFKGNASRPKANSGTLLSMAFRVVVTGNYGDTITLGAGQIRYKLTNSPIAADTILNSIQYNILIAPNASICGNKVGTNFAAEFGGTFGSGNTLNRGTGPSFPIPSYTYYNNVGASQSVGDGTYAIVNNLSPLASTVVNSRRRYSGTSCTIAPAVPATDSCKNRMFNGYWFISGDHTGTSNSAGNPPVADGTNGGYMLMVNADLATSEAYQQTINGLCPNTYYEFSAWIKNICPTCGIDSTGTATYTPGVYPNLTFVVDGLDRYSSGQMDTVGWVKKGFLFQTGASQTSITISIRNNAPGGGGNDWAMDDINIATCTPDLTLIPSGNSTVCLGNQVDMSATVRAFFNNYAEWAWEKSTDGGATWVSTGVSGTGTPVLNAGAYQYTATYPSFIADSAIHNTMFRVKVASTVANLSSANCSFAASNTIIVLVNNCTEVLKTSLLSFTGKLNDGLATLKWITDNEQANTLYEIERSDDKIHFTRIGSQHGQAPSGFGSMYSFTDNNPVYAEAYYRIKLMEGSAVSYSKIVYLNQQDLFGIKSLVNPFRNQLSFDVVSPVSGEMNILLIDTYGKLVWQGKRNITVGLNNIAISGFQSLSQGTYTLRVQMGDRLSYKRVVKTNQ